MVFKVVSANLGEIINVAKQTGSFFAETFHASVIPRSA